MTNSSNAAPAIRRTKRRAATIAASKIKKIAYADSQNNEETEKTKKNKKRRTSSSNSPSSSSVEDNKEHNKSRRPDPSPSLSDLLLLSSSSSALKSLSTMGLQSNSNSSVGSALFLSSVASASAQSSPAMLSTAAKQNIEHQRRRLERQVNSTGTMYLSYKTEVRMSKESPCKSPIMAKALEFTPVSYLPTTPLHHYQYRPPLPPPGSSSSFSINKNPNQRSTTTRRSGLGDSHLLGSDIKARRLL